MTINTWAMSVLRYGAKILKWNTTELKSLDRKTQKNLTIYDALNPKCNVDEIYVSCKLRSRGDKLRRVH